METLSGQEVGVVVFVVCDLLEDAVVEGVSEVGKDGWGGRKAKRMTVCFL